MADIVLVQDAEGPIAFCHEWPYVLAVDEDLGVGPLRQFPCIRPVQDHLRRRRRLEIEERLQVRQHRIDDVRSGGSGPKARDGYFDFLFQGAPARERTVETPGAARSGPPRPDIVLNAGLSRPPCGTVDIEHSEAKIPQCSFDGARLLGIFAGQDLEHDILDHPDGVARSLEHFEFKTPRRPSTNSPAADRRCRAASAA